MARGRIAILSVLVTILAVPVVHAQEDCEPDLIIATSDADTIFVEHFRAHRNCCTDLTLAMNVEGFTVDFYEGDAGDWCLCMCCFNLDYEAHGFAAGHYLVRVWNEDGTFFYGEDEVDVEGNGDVPVPGVSDRGDCMEPGGIAENPEIPTTWGRVRSQYR